MRIVTPIRFVSGTVGLWVAARIVIVMQSPFATVAGANEPPAFPGRPTESGRKRSILPGGTTARSSPEAPPLPARDTARYASVSPGIAGPAAGRAERHAAMTARRTGADRTILVTKPDISGPARPAGPPRLAAASDPSPTGIVTERSVPAMASTDGKPSRWSGSLYVYRRGDGPAALATGGQLGGSQAGARLAWRLNRAGPARFAAAVRLSSPLENSHEAEAAAGLDWHPVPGAPLRVSVERRVDLGGGGRNAWSAYAAGGFWREVRPGIVVDGYAQGGVVGARRGDLFADGALRGGYRHVLGRGHVLTVGAGAWAAAQPRVERIDLGPRVALSLPLGRATVTAATEWRIRVAGDAAPRSGPAFTLATDF